MIAKRSPIFFAGLICIFASTLLGAPRAYAQDCLVAEEAPGCLHGLPVDQYNALLGQMAANPQPQLARAPVDAAELRRYSLIQIDRSDVATYDSPGGQQTGTVNPGYSFVIPKSQVDGWAEIEPGKWVSKSNLSGTRASAFSGVFYSGPPHPMGWVLQGTKPSKYPGGPALKSTPTVPQYTLVYLFATVKVGDWEWYLIGPGQWVNQRGIGRIEPIAPPAGVGGRWIGIDLYEQVMIAYEGGAPVFATLVASGLRQWPTQEGLFKVWAKMKTDAMNGSMGKPDQYSIPVVPYVMYFNNSIALHGAFWHNGFGYRHSHGCVNLSISDAKWLFDWAGIDTQVYVYSSR
jgi:lipoprotein-anchoring transpeptidase ErfK/SrfK